MLANDEVSLVRSFGDVLTFIFFFYILSYGPLRNKNLGTRAFESKAIRLESLDCISTLIFKYSDIWISILKDF